MDHRTTSLAGCQSHALWDEYAAGQHDMLSFHGGSALRRAAEAIVDDLPDGPVTFIATSLEGVAVAATCAALSTDGSDWQQVALLGPHRPTQHRPVVVEPVDAGRGWRNAVRRRYPDAVVVIAADSLLVRV